MNGMAARPGWLYCLRILGAVLMLALLQMARPPAAGAGSSLEHGGSSTSTSMSLSELAGWWTNAVLCTYQIAADGIMTEYYAPGGTVPGGATRRQRLTPTARGFEITLLDGRPYGQADHSVDAEAVGRYEIRTLRRDLIQWLALDDPCAARKAWLHGLKMCRVVPLEWMIGVWEASDRTHGRLVVGDDLTYRIERGQGAEAEELLTGSLYFDPARGQVRFCGPAHLACPEHLVGSYDMQFDRLGRLVLTPASEPCPVRCAILSAWGPYSRAGAQPSLPKGKWHVLALLPLEHILW